MRAIPEEARPWKKTQADLATGGAVRRTYRPAANHEALGLRGWNEGGRLRFAVLWEDFVLPPPGHSGNNVDVERGQRLDDLTMSEHGIMLSAVDGDVFGKVTKIGRDAADAVEQSLAGNPWEPFHAARCLDRLIGVAGGIPSLTLVIAEFTALRKHPLRGHARW